MAQIFISYSHTDSSYAHRLANAIEANGLQVFIDDRRIEYGSQWPQVIQDNLDACSALVLVMTPRAEKSTWVQNELTRASRKKKIIFTLLLEGEPWLSVEAKQFVDVRRRHLPEQRFFTDLKKAIAETDQVVEPSIPNLIILNSLELLRIPAGSFLMGEKEEEPLAFENEKPQQTLNIPYDFWIGGYPVTNEQFRAFIDATNYRTIADESGGWLARETRYVQGVNWQHPLGIYSDLRNKDDHPVVQVAWLDALKFCEWMTSLAEKESELAGMQVRLPTEAEWERSARGDQGREWPWGNNFNRDLCNSGEGKSGGTTPVSAYSPRGNSPFGLADLIGNVWEWCHSLAVAYPYALDGRELQDEQGMRILRGGSYYSTRRYARPAYRRRRNADDRDEDIGFRVVIVSSAGRL